jgi:hypothetical protein
MLGVLVRASWLTDLHLNFLGAQVLDDFLRGGTRAA